MKNWSAHLVLIGLCSLYCATGSPLHAQVQRESRAAANSHAGEWPSYRGTASLSGHAPGVGAIHNPVIAWRHRVGTAKVRAVISPNSAVLQHAVDVPDESSFANASSNQTERFPPPKTGLIGGQQQAVASTPTTAYAEILADVPGLEKVEFVSGFDLTPKNGQSQYGPGSLAAWKDGGWQTIWETEPIAESFWPYPIIGDFDSDGQLEVAMLPWRSLRIYDAATGTQEAEKVFTPKRSYGFFGVYDFDRDGTSEFLVMADFAQHIDVLGYRGGKLTLLWQDEIQLDIEHQRAIMRVLPEPVADLNGDGRQELIVTVFNRDDDRRWHTVLRDALSGAVIADLPNELVQGVADVDGDGASDLLTIETADRHVPRWGTVRVRSLQDQQCVVAWECKNSAWQCHELPQASHQQHYAKAGRHGALTQRVGQRDVVVLQQRSGKDSRNVAISVGRWNGKDFDLAPTIVARQVDAVALNDDGAMFIEFPISAEINASLSISSGEIEFLSIVADKSSTDEAKVREKEKGIADQAYLTPPVVVRTPRCEQPLIIVQESSHPSWIAIEPPYAGEPARTRWQFDGGLLAGQTELLGSAANPIEFAELQLLQFGSVVGDLSGNGRRSLLVAGSSPTGVARVAALDVSNCKFLWHHDFENFSSGRRDWNFGGAVFVQAGNFTSPSNQDVLVTLARCSMHTEETFLLAGATGTQIWHRDRQIADRGFGGQLFAAADFNRNGLDDLASFYPSIQYIVDGATGKDLMARENYWPGALAQPVYWGQPLAGRFDPGSEEPSLVFATTRRSMIGRVGVDGNLLWSDADDIAANGYPGVGDFDGDKATDLVFVGFQDGTRCYDAASGKEKWRLPVGAGKNVGSVVSGDIDGDGRDEAVFAIDKTLYCVGMNDSGVGVEQWQIELPTVISDPAIADVSSSCEKNGQHLSVLVTGIDGYVYCIDDDALR